MRWWGRSRGLEGAYTERRSSALLCPHTTCLLSSVWLSWGSVEEMQADKMTSAAGPGKGTPGVIAKAGCPLLGILFRKRQNNWGKKSPWFCLVLSSNFCEHPFSCKTVAWTFSKLDIGLKNSRFVLLVEVVKHILCDVSFILYAVFFSKVMIVHLHSCKQKGKELEWGRRVQGGAEWRWRECGCEPGGHPWDTALPNIEIPSLTGNCHLQSSLFGSLNVDSYYSAILCSKVLEILAFQILYYILT